jgi:hypothetical protein
MWTSIFKAFFILGIVLGVEELFFSIYWRFFKHDNIMALRWLARGISLIVTFSLSLWLLTVKSLDPWNDFWVFAVAWLPMSIFTIAVEAYIKVRFENKALSSLFEKPPEPDPETWKQNRVCGKTRFMMNFGLVFALLMAHTALVFSIIAPDLLSPYWWPPVILMFSIIGVILGNAQWNANEKRLISKNS